jgi:hypothetical protein
LIVACLTGSNVRFVCLKPLRYEFGSAHNAWDANWLVLRFNACDGVGPEWIAEAATVLAWDLHRLIPWLRHVAAGNESIVDEWEAMEPSIIFHAERSQGTLTLEAHINFLFMPPDLFNGKYYEDGDVVISFTPSYEEIRRFADELEAEMAHFPERKF